ncbi:MarR family transcriptional regulator [Leptospira gomenensis]|uniref:MarR family transcriptional regulator n=3 Tax=Leptospira gomenensis TaxID=2484974 RepID=A0A5F1YIN0_9LEPT|nr:MarR family transcriptional regulator [Leptospira gomenensis]TGK42577.1 MarR family transcriptional regulator [Leptospira gomenensis]TGK55825.1 MarR family transcriptional regulator [Leptospira gomenensis]
MYLGIRTTVFKAPYFYMSENRSTKRPRAELLDALSSAGRRMNDANVLYYESFMEKFGLNPTDRKALVLLEKGPITAGSLAQDLDLTTGAITGVIDRLEKAGLVRRIADPTDRRKVLVQSFPEAIRETSPTYAALREAMQGLFQKYGDEDLEFLIRFQEDFAAILIRESVALRDRRPALNEVIAFGI